MHRGNGTNSIICRKPIPKRGEIPIDSLTSFWYTGFNGKGRISCLTSSIEFQLGCLLVVWLL